MNRRKFLVGAGVLGLGATAPCVQGGLIDPAIPVRGWQNRRLFKGPISTRRFIGLTPEEIKFYMSLAKREGHKAVWDFNAALGDTIREKYEALYVVTVYASNKVYRRTGKMGANAIVTSPEVASIFETATAGFEPASTEEWKKNPDHILFCGTISSRWRLYKTICLEPNELLLGCEDELGLADPYYSATVEVQNFVI